MLPSGWADGVPTELEQNASTSCLSESVGRSRFRRYYGQIAIRQQGDSHGDSTVRSGAVGVRLRRMTRHAGWSP